MAEGFTEPQRDGLLTATAYVRAALHGDGEARAALLASIDAEDLADALAAYAGTMLRTWSDDPLGYLDRTTEYIARRMDDDAA